ncbi:MAG TPA: hypothetical protein VF017_05400 [Thermoanaerobaculia bacterium]|nr:hypothetical protein [Thermoanaerobaculia bacterium]
MSAGTAGAAAGYPLWRWYAALVGGLAPILLGGFLASAAADRLIFAGWALAAGALYVTVLHRTFLAAKPMVRRGAPLAVWLGAAALFALLAHRHWEELTLGFTALMPVGAAG